MKNAKLRLGAFVLALVMCFGLLVSCGESGLSLEDVKKDPYAAIMDGDEKYMDALGAKYGDVFKVFEKLEQGTGTYSATVTAPEAGEFTLNAVVDPATGAYSGKATVGADGASMDISLWGDKNDLALSAPFILGENNYGVKLDTIEADLANSELITSLTGMTFDEMKSALETEAGIKWDDIKGIFSVENWKDALTKYMTDAEAIVKDKEFTVVEETFKIGETELPVISVQATLTKEDGEKITDLAFDSYESMFGKIVEAAGMSFDDIRAEIDGETDELADMNDITVKSYLSKSTGAIVAEDITSGDDIKASIVYGEDVSKKLEMTADITMTIEEETANVVVAVKEITDEGKGGFDIDATVKNADEEHTVAVDIVRNDADGKYEIKIAADGEDVGNVAGTLTYSADEFKLTVDSATFDGETAELGLTLSAKAGGTVEAIPEYTNILTASAEELEGLMTIIGSMMYTPDYDDYYGDEYIGDDYYGDEYYDDEYIDGGESYDDITIEDMMEGMTQEEIDQFYKDLEDLGMITDDIMGMLGEEY